MLIKGDRPPTKGRGHGRAISGHGPNTPKESTRDLRQEMNEMRGTLAGMLRAVDILIANQLRQGQMVT